MNSEELLTKIHRLLNLKYRNMSGTNGVKKGISNKSRVDGWI